MPKEAAMEEKALTFWRGASQLSGRAVELLSAEAAGTNDTDRESLRFARLALTIIGQNNGEKRAFRDQLQSQLLELAINVFRALSRERGEEFGQLQDMERYLAEAVEAIAATESGRRVKPRNAGYYLLRAVGARSRDVLRREGFPGD